MDKNCNNKNCKQLNPQDLSSFSKNRSKIDGYQERCKTCNSMDSKNSTRQNPNKKVARDRLYRSKNKEKIKEYNKKWEKDNPNWRKNYELRWNKQNIDKVKAKDTKWRKANPEKRAAKQMRRQANKFNATPPWLTKEHLEQILEFYILAKELQWLSEEPLEVDHIIPLQGKNVCGLHVPWNLQILPKSMNIKKGNKL